MADRPSERLGGKTPMEVAKKPIMDMLASKGTVGTVLNVPTEMVPESDTANLAVLSYNPLIYSKGRSPLEAAAMGIPMSEEDTAFRCNLVTLTEEDRDYSERTIIDHSADNISSEDAAILIEALEQALSDDDRHFFPGMSYRESMIIKNAPAGVTFSRPHDIPGRVIGEYLPAGEDGAYYADIMRKSYDVLVNHPLNLERKKNGLHPANSVWFWSPGKKASLPSFSEKWGIKGSMISAVDLLKGIAFLADMEVLSVEGATGTVDTNYAGKAAAAIDAFERGQDFVYIHLEGPDECGHQGDADGKVLSIENIDAHILAPLYDYLSVCGEAFKIMVLPDHPTPLDIRTHSSEAVPFFIYSSRESLSGPDTFTEKTAADSPLYVAKGQNLLEFLIDKDPPAGTDEACALSDEKKEENADSKKKSEHKKADIIRSITDFAEIIAVSLVVVMLVMSFLFRHSPVIGSSMAPTLSEGDVLLVSDLFYRPQKNDIVILQVDDPGHLTSTDRPLVKRIIAVGGDSVKINFKTWEITVNGNVIDQSYLGEHPLGAHMNSYAIKPDANGICSFTVSDGHVFVMGDNRNDSLDSRSLGEIDERAIIGKVITRILPLNKIGSPS